MDIQTREADFAEPWFLIIGAGALGGYLAWELSRKSSCSVKILTKSHPGMRMAVFKNKLGVHDFSYECVNLSQLSDTTLSRNIIIYFCVQPENLTPVLSEVYQTILRWKSISLGFIFCGNGVLSKEDESICNRIEKINPDFFAIRSLVYIGIQKSLLQDGTLKIEHFGGNLMKMGLYCGSANRAMLFFRRIKDYFEDQNWEVLEEIRKEEITKFFVNFVIAITVGPRLIENKRVLHLLGANEKNLVADMFSELWIDVRQEELKASLGQTLIMTGSNVNSVSKAWAAGSSQTILHFFALLKQRAIDGGAMHALSCIDALEEKTFH